MTQYSSKGDNTVLQNTTYNLSKILCMQEKEVCQTRPLLLTESLKT